MNKQRRKILGNLMDQLEALRPQIEALVTGLTPVAEALEAERDAERESFENLPDGLRQAEKGVDMEVAIDELTNAYETISAVAEVLGDLDLSAVLSNIDNARGAAE